MLWQPAELRGKRVWAEVQSPGQLAVASGRVGVRYSQAAGAKVYHASASRVDLLAGDVVELDQGVRAESGANKPTSSRYGSAGQRTGAQVQAAAQSAARLLETFSKDTLVAFTDGSCRGNPGPAGSGAFLQLPDGRVWQASRSLGIGTNNIAEIDAIALALEGLEQLAWPLHAPVAVLSDSKYASGVLAGGWKAKANREQIDATKAMLARRPGVRLHWVAGHAGIAGNECADRLANEGMEGFTRTTMLPAP